MSVRGIRNPSRHKQFARRKSEVQVQNTYSIHRDQRDCRLQPAVGFAAARSDRSATFWWRCATLAASRSVSQRLAAPREGGIKRAPRQAYHRASSRQAIRRNGAKAKAVVSLHGRGRDFVMSNDGRQDSALSAVAQSPPLSSRGPARGWRRARL
jgi:hypothetical protein